MSGDTDTPTYAPPVPITIGEVVEVCGQVLVNEEAADYGSYWSYAFAGTNADDKVMVAGEDPFRKRIQINVTGTGPVYIGSEAQCSAVKAGNLAAAGMILATGTVTTITNKQPVWMISDLAHTATVGILNERRNAANPQ